MITVVSKKEQFLIQYVLNRALISPSLDGQGAAVQATKAWDEIQKEIKKRPE